MLYPCNPCNPWSIMFLVEALPRCVSSRLGGLVCCSLSGSAVCGENLVATVGTNATNAHRVGRVIFQQPQFALTIKHAAGRRPGRTRPRADIRFAVGPDPEHQALSGHGDVNSSFMVS